MQKTKTAPKCKNTGGGLRVSLLLFGFTPLDRAGLGDDTDQNRREAHHSADGKAEHAGVDLRDGTHEHDAVGGHRSRDVERPNRRLNLAGRAVQVKQRGDHGTTADGNGVGDAIAVPDGTEECEESTDE